MKFSIAAMNFILVTIILHSFVNVSPAVADWESVYFSYNSTTGWKDINHYGSATIDGGILQLNGPEDTCGWATYSTYIPYGINTSFSTHFSFIINSTDSLNSGEGFAFFLSPKMQPVSTCSGKLGLFPDTNSTNDTNDSKKNETVAVEFDTRRQEEWDLSSYHIGIDVNDIYSVRFQNYPLILNGTVAHAWVSYSAGDQRLNVSLSYQGDPQSPGDPLLSYFINLYEVLPTTVAVGFSASNFYAEVHQVLSWEFESSTFIDRGVVECPKATATKTILAILCPIGVLLVGLGCIVILRRKMCNNTEADRELPKKYSHKELALATSNFASKNKLGEGGFGPVFKGYLRDSCDEVAVKQLKQGSNQGAKEFKSEVEILSRLGHPNLVELFGWCEEKGKQLLVYKYMPNGSLNSLLFDRHRLLLWPKRYEIVLNLADSLCYLQAENKCNKEVVHRDIKPDNVLLDSNLEAKLSDFGLARLVDHGISANTTNAAGSWGYVAPELFSEDGRIKPSTQSDIYSFGIVLLEIASGRRPVDLDLMRFVWEHYDRNELLKAADARLRGDYSAKEIERVLFVGLWCAHPIPSERPAIPLVRKALMFEDCELPVLPNYPQLLYGRLYGQSPPTKLSYSTGTSMCSSQELV